MTDYEKLRAAHDFKMQMEILGALWLWSETERLILEPSRIEYLSDLSTPESSTAVEYKHED